MTIKGLLQHFPLRARRLNQASINPGGVFILYWLRTAMRDHDNPALSFAVSASADLGLPMLVYQGLSEHYPYANARHHTFILEGARDLAQQFANTNIRYVFHCERPGMRGPFLRSLAQSAAVVVTEDMPVPPLRGWSQRLADSIDAPMIAVDTACVVPMATSQHAPERAFQFRKHVAKHQQSAPTSPTASGSVAAWNGSLPFEPVDFTQHPVAALVDQCAIDHTVGPVLHTRGGTTAGYARWEHFRQHHLPDYHKRRNDAADETGTSRMSAYLHYGMVSPFRLVREAQAVGGDGAKKYIDELVTWRELAYHWCAHTSDAESLSALPQWAQETMRKHIEDKRIVYPVEALNRGTTGQQLWDLAQRSLLARGELHNNVRMSWGKAIPEWTKSPDAAIRCLVALNHRYALDGRDPASYGGLLWCLGLFDRPFTPEAPVLGTVRERSLSAHQKRIDLAAYKSIVHRRPSTKRVAIVGAGLAGSLCARVLSDHNVDVVVFDKGRRPGGRLSSRQQGEFSFDYGAQYFTNRHPPLKRHIAAWKQLGLVDIWPGTEATLSGEKQSAQVRTEERLVGTPSMAALVDHLQQDIDVSFASRITVLSRHGEEILVASEDAEHSFDRVVLAIPAPQASALLTDWNELQTAVSSCVFAPCWCAMFGLSEPLAVDWTSARIEQSPISWIARNQTKPGRDAARESLVVHASPTWSDANLSISAADALETLQQETWRLLSLIEPPQFARAHLWRYALVTKPIGVASLYDDGVAVCGDGLLGGRIEAALRSGAAAAARILASLG